MSFLARYRRFVAAPLGLALLVTVTAFVPSVSATPSGVAPDADGLIVQWEEGYAESGPQALQRRGLDIRQSLPDDRAVCVDADPADIPALLDELSDMPGVALVEPNYRVYLAWQPDDPGYADQWAYGRIQAETAWDVERGEATVVVAVVDTGVDLDHPDLAANLDTANDRNFTVTPIDPAYTEADDDHGHGSHVAGIIAAETDNGTGVAGTAPGVTILPIKAITSSGYGSAITLSTAIDYATSVGVDVINLSVAFDYGQSSELVNQAIHAATEAGIVVVAASGNSGGYGVRYPAAYPDCIAVGATTMTDGRAYFSTYGPELDVMAPGGRASMSAASEEMVLSTYKDGAYAYMEGTSMATPFVSAAAAILLSYEPAATPSEIRTALESSAKDLGAAGFDNYTGNGLIQLRNALDLMTGLDTTPPVTTSDIVPSYDDEAVVSLAADDGDGFGVAATYLSCDGGALQRASGITVADYGPHTVSYWSDDVVGNRETTNTEAFFVDDTLPPVTTSDALDSYESTATITLEASDGTGSGVADTYYSLDDGARVYALEMTISEIGSHTLTFGSTDAVGNVETSTTVEFRVWGVPDVSRVSGTTRYDTAVRMSESAFAAGSAQTVVLASGQGFPDALSASALGGALGSPVLLTARDYLPYQVLGELDRLGATDVIIVGGIAAVSESVEEALTDAGLSVERVSGNDRYATAAQVARRVAEESAPDAVPVAFVARGDHFPDALAVSSIAAAQGYPVLLTRTGDLAPATADALEDLGVSEVVIAGGTAAVSEAVASSIAAVPGVETVSRWYGATRYTTAATVVRNGIDRGWIGTAMFGVATGADFPDALGGGVVSARLGGTMVLTEADSLTGAAADVIGENGASHLPILVYGGTAAVSEDVLTTLSALRF